VRTVPKQLTTPEATKKKNVQREAGETLIELRLGDLKPQNTEYNNSSPKEPYRCNYLLGQNLDECKTESSLLVAIGGKGEKTREIKSSRRQKVKFRSDHNNWKRPEKPHQLAQKQKGGRERSW